MRQHATNDHEDTVDDLPPIKIPAYVPASPEEITRRQALAERADRIREQLGPIGFSVVDLIREMRDESSLDECN